MNRQQKRDVYQGVIGVTVTPYYDNYEVNYGKMADLTKWWISNGMVRGDAALKVWEKHLNYAIMNGLICSKLQLMLLKAR